MNSVDLAGQRFSRLVALKRSAAKKGDKAAWDCICDCGKTAIVTTNRLRAGVTRSCGCLRREVCRALLTTHGGNDSPEYSIWQGIKSRCLNPRGHLFPYYGGRGITITEPWRSDFATFRSDILRDIGARPSLAHSLDRINNNGNYEPGNVRWATRIEQGANKRNNRNIEWRGETKTLAQWGRVLSIPRRVLYDRTARYGWTVDRAFTTPVRPY